MKGKVLKPFPLGGRTATIGEIVEVEDGRGRELMKGGLIDWIPSFLGQPSARPASGRRAETAGHRGEGRPFSGGQRPPPATGTSGCTPASPPVRVQIPRTHSQNISVEFTIEELRRRFEEAKERDRKIGDTIAVLEKLVELGWVEDRLPEVSYDEAAGVTAVHLSLKSDYSLEQIASWAGVPIKLRAGTPPPFEGSEGARGEAWERLGKLGFEVRSRDGKISARRVLVRCGSAAAWLEAPA